MVSRKEWIAGARLRTLPAAIAPVMVGTALAGKAADWRGILALVVSLSLQIAVNYANDYSDGIKGTDSDRVGPLRLVGSGIASPASVKRAAFLFFGIAMIAGLVLALTTSLILIGIGALAIVAAWTYTGGPKPYGYSALGEVSVFLFFGLIATVGTFYVQTESVTLASFLLSIPIGVLACAILGLNNLRDREKDAKAKKRTLAVILGDKGARNSYTVLLMVAHLGSISLYFVTPSVFSTLFLLPFSARLARNVLNGAQGKDLIRLLANTGKLQIAFAFFLSFALVTSIR